MTSITPTQLEIIGFLINQENPQNIRGIAKTLKKSYSLVYNNLEDLRKLNVIEKENLPPVQIITLNQYSPVEFLIKAERRMTEVFLEKKSWLSLFLNDILSSTTSLFFIMLVFGSYAKGKATNKSDLDLLIIVPKKEDINNMEKVLKQQYIKIKTQTIVIDELDFLETIKKSQEFNVSNEAIKHHIILYGHDSYYQLLKKAERWKSR